MDDPVVLNNNYVKGEYVDHSRYGSVTDEELVERILAGEIDLFEVILRRYNQKLYRIVRSYLSEEERVREVVQSAYVKAYENLDQFRAEAKFSTWLVRIVINEALAFLNKRKRYSDRELSRLDENGSHGNLIDNDDPERHAVRADLKRLVEKAIDTLPPKYRTVFVMREIEGMSTRETAGCLEITPGNVKVRLHRAKNYLREELEKRVMDREIFDFKGKRCDRMVTAVMEEVYGKISDNPELAVRRID